MGQMVSFGLSMAVASLGLWMMNLGDRLVIGHYMTAADLGLYGAVYSVAGNDCGGYRAHKHAVLPAPHAGGRVEGSG